VTAYAPEGRVTLDAAELSVAYTRVPERKGPTVKDIKLRPSTADHDYGVKVRKMTQALGEGHEVRVFVVFRGRELGRPVLGQRMLRRVVEDLREIAVVVAALRTEGRHMYVTLAPRTGTRRPPPPAAPPPRRRLELVRSDPP
jgi:translation initiation factor IF-3